jgi:TIR domain
MAEPHLFISYASHDRAAAEALCAGLESRGLRCWMTPRDVRAGEDWGEAIVLLSRSADASPHVRNEVVAAIAHRIPLVPVRPEETEPTGALRLHLVGRHWLDAFPPPAAAHAEALAASVRLLLREEELAAAGALLGPARGRHDAAAPPPPPPRASAAAVGRRTRMAAFAVAAAALLALLPAGWLLFGREPARHEPPAAGADPQAWAGGQGRAPQPDLPANPTLPATPAAAAASGAPSRDIAVVNASQQDIDRLHLSPTSVTSRGPDLLGILQLPAGSRVLLRAPSEPGGCWRDVRVVYHDSSFEVRSGQNVCILTELRFDGSTARRPAQGGTR